MESPWWRGSALFVLLSRKEPWMRIRPPLFPDPFQPRLTSGFRSVINKQPFCWGWRFVVFLPMHWDISWMTKTIDQAYCRQFRQGLHALSVAFQSPVSYSVGATVRVVACTHRHGILTSALVRHSKSSCTIPVIWYFSCQAPVLITNLIVDFDRPWSSTLLLPYRCFDFWRSTPKCFLNIKLVANLSLHLLHSSCCFSRWIC